MKEVLRMCIACRQMKNKENLTRIVKLPSGEVIIDKSGKQDGRGAYICKSLSCFKKARKSKRIESSLECTIPEEIYEKMEEELAVGR